MRRGTCDTCGAATVRAARNGITIGSASAVGLRPDVGPDFRGMLRPHQTDLWTFACTNCGRVELYLLEPDALAYIGENWTEVPPAP